MANKDDLFEQYGFTGGNQKSESPDFGGFMSGATAIPETEEPVTETVGEEYIAPADAAPENTDPNVDYMANMQNMFKSLSQDDTEEPVEEEPEETAEEEMTTEFSSFMLGKEGDIPVKSQTDLLSSEADPFRDAPSVEVRSEELEAEEKGAAAESGPAESDAQVSRRSRKAEKQPVEKGEEYWSFVDSLLDNFDDTKERKSRPRVGYNVYEEEPKVSAEEAAAAVAEATAPVVEVPVETEVPEKKNRKIRSGSRFSLNKNASETVLPFEEPSVETSKEFDEELLKDYSISAAPVDTSASTATEEEARSTGEAPAAGGYFMPRSKANPNHKPAPSLDPDAPRPEAAPAPVVEEPAEEVAVVAETVLEEAPVLVPEVAVEETIPAPEVPKKLSRKERKAAKKAEKEAAKKAAEEAKLAELKEAEEARLAEEKAAEEAALAAKKAEEAALAAAAAEAELKQAEAEVSGTVSETVVSVDDDDIVITQVNLEEGESPREKASEPDESYEKNAEFDATYVTEKKKGGALSVVRRIIIALAALAILACAVVLGYSYYQNKVSQKQFTQAATLYTEDAGLKNLAAAQKKYPDVTFPKNMQVKFAGLYAQNSDLEGWVSIPGTALNYPVVQTDNDTFYMNHNFTKAYSEYGTPFLSCRNDPKELDLNNVVYGQSKDDTMFSTLASYRNPNFFEKNPLIEYSTLYEDYTFKVYGVFVTNSDPEQDGGYLFDYTVPNLGTVESFAGFVQAINERRLYDTGVDILSTDKLLTLSTSADDFDGARLVVVARLLRDGESKAIDKSLVETNESPRFPAAWYEATGIENPYVGYDQWVPTIS